MRPVVLLVAHLFASESACRRAAPPAPTSGSAGAVAGVATAVAATADAAVVDVAAPARADAPREGSALAPLPPEPLFTNLTVTGFPEAVVSLPNGATTRRPTLVVLHGTGDRPDYNCDAWRHVTGAWGFVLCLRGRYVPAESTKDDARFTLRGGATLRTHLEAALGALAARFGDYVDVERPVLAGFSLGAWQVADLAIGAPARFTRVAAIEGGHGVWTASAAGAFAKGGGSRVLFGCGSSWCMTPATAAATRLREAGVEARLVHANVGHTTDRPLQEQIMKEADWFFEGDPRWARSRAE